VTATGPQGDDTTSGLRSPVKLRKRADFLAAARGLRLSKSAFALQARRRGACEAPDVVRVGFTCSKKVGNAVARNRAKRRLRAAAALVLPGEARSGWDYVLIGRRDQTADHPFEALCTDLAAALRSVHARAK
jgi:ribonuclease P protein component